MRLTGLPWRVRVPLARVAFPGLRLPASSSSSAGLLTQRAMRGPGASSDHSPSRLPHESWELPYKIPNVWLLKKLEVLAALIPPAPLQVPPTEGVRRPRAPYRVEDTKSVSECTVPAPQCRQPTSRVLMPAHCGCVTYAEPAL